MIEIVESKIGDVVLIPCPHCGKYSEEDMQIVFAAYRDNAPLRHLDCGKDFWVELSCQTRDAKLRIGADDAGHTCPLCNGSGKDPNDPDPSSCPKCKGAGQV